MEPFKKRDLRAFSAEPLLVYPTHYTGDPGYISDTETSVVWDNETVKTDWDRAKSRKTQEQEELSFEAQNSDVLQSELETFSSRDELWRRRRGLTETQMRKQTCDVGRKRNRWGVVKVFLPPGINSCLVVTNTSKPKWNRILHSICNLISLWTEEVGGHSQNRLAAFL